jgi:hypothetical protein
VTIQLQLVKIIIIIIIICIVKGRLEYHGEEHTGHLPVIVTEVWEIEGMEGPEFSGSASWQLYLAQVISQQQ